MSLVSARRCCTVVVLTGPGLLLMAAPVSAAPASVLQARGTLADLQPTVSDVTDGAYARVTAVNHNGRTTVVLRIKGLDRAQAGGTLGAHVHERACVTGDGPAAGPHYNTTTGQTPPEISPLTEVWLDFTVTAGGTATAVANVPFGIPAGAARSVVVHQQSTDPQNGVAGPRLACLSVEF